MKILTFYFSGSGNTKWAAETFDRMLKQSGHTSTLAAVEAVDMAAYLQSVPEGLDYIGFAQPIYAADIPRIMRGSIRQFTEAAKGLSAIPAGLFMINTFAYVNGHGVLEARKLFRRMPFRLRHYLNVKMVNSAPQKRADAQRQARLDERSKQKAEKQLSAFVKRLENGRPYLGGIGPQIFGGKLVRAALRGAIRNNYRRMHVDMEVCTKCMQCVRDCPAQCIAYRENAFVFSQACEACMRCYHHCPVHAIANDKR